jgi:exopolyphosphatase/guanosine-5'-triphosphate,3'-diphosphate pyrophosphatase
MGDAQLTQEARTVAVIDIGSNSIRLVVAQIKADGALEVLERIQRPVRLGRSTFRYGRLSQQAMNAAIAILRDYRGICDTYHAVKVRAVATSAVRDASNNDVFLDRASIAADFDVEIIDLAEESRLTVAAVRESLKGVLDISKSIALVVEIGGGSGLVTVLKNGAIAASEGYNLGSIRLQETLNTAQEPPERATDMLRHHVANVVQIIQRTMRTRDAQQFIAVGNDARVAARLIGKPLREPDLYTLSLEDLDALIKKWSKRTAQELARQYSIPFANAETLTPALIAYLALLRACGTAQMVVSRVSIRDGLLLDLAHSMTGKEDPEVIASTLQSAQAIGEKYQYDAPHGRHVAEMAVRLFDALKAAHRLPPRCRILLRVAGVLHEIGGFVSSRAHHKHSYYLIANSGIFGLRNDEVELVAQVARYHRRSGPRASHREYVALPREQRVVVAKLAALLRVADALDRGHEQRIKDFAVEAHSDRCVLTVSGVADLALERNALARKADVFEDAFGMKVRLEGDESAAAPAESPLST